MIVDLGRVVAERRERARGPPAKLSSLPTAIEKVKHTPTRGHVTIGEKDHSGYLPHFRAQPTAVMYVCTLRMQNDAWPARTKGKERNLLGSWTDWRVTRKRFTEIDSSEKPELSRLNPSIAKSPRL